MDRCTARPIGQFHDTALAGDRLTPEGLYEPITVDTAEDGAIRGLSEVLGVELRWVAGALRFWNPATGDYMPDLTEAESQRNAALERVRQLEAELRRQQS